MSVPIIQSGPYNLSSANKTIKEGVSINPGDDIVETCVPEPFAQHRFDESEVFVINMPSDMA